VKWLFSSIINVALFIDTLTHSVSYLGGHGSSYAPIAVNYQYISFLNYLLVVGPMWRHLVIRQSLQGTYVVGTLNKACPATDYDTSCQPIFQLSWDTMADTIIGQELWSTVERQYSYIFVKL